MAKFYVQETGIMKIKCSNQKCGGIETFGVEKNEIVDWHCKTCGCDTSFEVTVTRETVKYEQEGGGTKYDTGKPRIGEMIKDFGIPLLEVCKVWEFGTVKYSKSNWKKVDGGEDRYTNAMIRHFLAEDEEGIDAETEIEHYAHLAWNALSRIKFIMENKKNGD